MIELPEPLEKLVLAGVVISEKPLDLNKTNGIFLFPLRPDTSILERDNIFVVGPTQEGVKYDYIFHLYNSDHSITFIRPMGRKYPEETVVHLNHFPMSFPRYFLYDTLESMKSKFFPEILEKWRDSSIKLEDYDERVRKLKIVK